MQDDDGNKYYNVVNIGQGSTVAVGGLVAGSLPGAHDEVHKVS